jgi:hypothetical protein
MFRPGLAVVVRDPQVRRPFEAAKALAGDELRRCADAAVEAFLRLYGR